jgi:hypothetical protein
VALGGASWSLNHPLEAASVERVIDAAIASGVTLITRRARTRRATSTLTTKG